MTEAYVVRNAFGGTVRVEGQGDDNPYDEGILFDTDHAAEIVRLWQDAPIDNPMTSRVGKLLADTVFAVVLYDEDGHTVDEWACTTEFHDFETGDQDRHGGGEPAFSTANWPFEGTLEIEPWTEDTE